jgi:hypothetical protein
MERRQRILYVSEGQDLSLKDELADLIRNGYEIITITPYERYSSSGYLVVVWENVPKDDQ